MLKVKKKRHREPWVGLAMSVLSYSFRASISAYQWRVMIFNQVNCSRQRQLINSIRGKSWSRHCHHRTRQQRVPSIQVITTVCELRIEGRRTVALAIHLQLLGSLTCPLVYHRRGHSCQGKPLSKVGVAKRVVLCSTAAMLLSTLIYKSWRQSVRATILEQLFHPLSPMSTYWPRRSREKRRGHLGLHTTRSKSQRDFSKTTTWQFPVEAR